MREARLRQRDCSSPLDLRAIQAALCMVRTARPVIPHRTGNQLRMRDPLVGGTPRITHPTAAPKITASSKLETPKDMSRTCRHKVLSIRPRNSVPIPRRTSSQSRTTAPEHKTRAKNRRQERRSKGHRRPAAARPHCRPRNGPTAEPGPALIFRTAAEKKVNHARTQVESVQDGIHREHED